MIPLVIAPGTTFFLWTVVQEVEPDRKRSRSHTGGFQTYRCFLVRCACGAERIVRLSTLRRGYSRSCGQGGCFHRVRGREPGMPGRPDGGPDLRTKANGT